MFANAISLIILAATLAYADDLNDQDQHRHQSGAQNQQPPEAAESKRGMQDMPGMDYSHMDHSQMSHGGMN